MASSSGRIGDDVLRISSVSAAPESSPFGMKPRAPQRCTSGPKSEQSRLDVRTTAGAPSTLGDARRDVEAVEVREVDVEQHEVGVQLAGRSDGAEAVRRLADHVEALALQQEASGRPEGRVVVDDEDLRAHGLFESSALHRASYLRLATPRRGRDLAVGRRPDRARRRARCRRRTAVAPGRPRTRRRSPRRCRRRPRASAPAPSSARSRAILSSDAAMNGWPPQPGLTVMQSARSTSSLGEDVAAASPGRPRRRRCSRARGSAASA